MRLSVVIPAYNEAAAVPSSIRSVTTAIRRSRHFAEAEIIVADDGSTDETAAAALGAAVGIPVRVASLPRNSGRFAARQVGLREAAGEYVLFLDAGITVNPDGLRFVGDELAARGADVWNAHTVLAGSGSPLQRFWVVVSALAFPAYLDDPRTTSFGSDDFDRFPKGTTCFFAPKAVLDEAYAEFRSRYADSRHANDDGPLLRSVAQRRRIHISPRFACTYVPRDKLRPFLRHAHHRGIVFLDGHGRPESRFFPIVVAFYPLSVIGLASALWRPRLVLVFLGATAAAAGAAAAGKRRSSAEVASFAALAPVYLVAHGAGMWKGLALALAPRTRGRR